MVISNSVHTFLRTNNFAPACRVTMKHHSGLQLLAVLVVIVSALAIRQESLAYNEVDYARNNVVTAKPPVFLHTGTTTAPQSYLRSLCLNKRGQFPHPLDCRKYVDCWDGRVLEKYCPANLVFSDIPGVFCDYREYVECGIRPILVPTVPAPVTPTKIPAVGAPVTPTKIPAVGVPLLPTKIPAVVAPLPPTKIPAVVAPPGFTKLSPIRDNLYLFSTIQVDFAMARTLCRYYGPRVHLVQINDAFEQKLIADTIFSVGEPHKSMQYWTGLTRRDFPTFTWVASNNHTLGNGYQAWDTGRPSTLPNNANQCMQISGANGFKWIDTTCDVQNRFICEFTP